MSDIANAARDFAVKAHAGQVDKLGYPYPAHVVHIGRTVARFGPIAEATGYLHDTVEDCDVTLAEIEKQFGPEIAAGVDAMTKRAGEDYQSDYLDRLLSDPIGPLVKYADSRHNFGKIHLLSDETAKARLTRKYLGVFEKLETARPELCDWGPVQQIFYTAGGWALNGQTAVRQ